MWLLLLLSSGFAQDWITSISEPYELPSGGTWARPFPSPQGWNIFLGGSSMRIGELKKMQGNWEVHDIRVISDQEGVHFNDHGVKKCPDGSYLHVASRDSDVPNNSAHVWRYSSDFEVTASEVYEENSDQRQYNDPALLCSRLSQGVASSILGGPMDFGNHYFEVDALGVKQNFTELSSYPRLNGGALFAEDREGLIFHLGMDHGQPLQINTYNEDFTLLDEKSVDLLESPKRAYWPQGLIRVGDYYLLTFMGRDDTWGNGDLGDVFLGIFDREWNLLKTEQITHYEANFAMRPWISRSGDQVLIAYDGNLKFYLVELVIDLEAFGVAESDPDTGTDPALWDGHFTPETQECACSGGSASLVLWVLLFIPLRRRE